MKWIEIFSEVNLKSLCQIQSTTYTRPDKLILRTPRMNADDHSEQYLLLPLRKANISYGIPTAASAFMLLKFRLLINSTYFIEGNSKLVGASVTLEKKIARFFQRVEFISTFLIFAHQSNLLKGTAKCRCDIQSNIPCE